MTTELTNTNKVLYRNFEAVNQIGGEGSSPSWGLYKAHPNKENFCC